MLTRQIHENETSRQKNFVFLLVGNLLSGMHIHHQYTAKTTVEEINQCVDIQIPKHGINLMINSIKYDCPCI